MQIELTSPFPFEALPRVWRWIEPFRDRVSDDFGPQDLPSFLKFMEGKWERQRTWAVFGDGELGGLIQFERFTPWVGTGHFLLKPEFQRQGISIRAARLALAQAFETEKVGKLIFEPLDGNLAIGSLLVNLGATREGRLKNQTLCGGKLTDVLMYGLTREAFEEKSHAGSHDQQHQQ